MSGITNKLRAYYSFLKEYPDYRYRLVMVQFLVSPSCISENIGLKQTGCNIMERIPILKELYEEVKKITEKIQREFGSESLRVLTDDINLNKRLAIWS
jgi:trehalose-6-phosphate synthase